jgi:predicted transcriptional regulator
LADSATLTVKLPKVIKDQLADLAARTQRTHSFLAGEAIEAFVKRETAILDGIDRGLADLRAGRLVDHEAAMDELDVMIEKVAAGQT